MLPRLARCLLRCRLMDTVGEILREKGSRVVTASPEETVFEAVDRMCTERVGSVLVCEGLAPIGTFTERDLMLRVVCAGLDPRSTRLAEVMTREVVCVRPDTKRKEAMAILTERRCRHLPVVDEGRVAGLVSIGDLVRAESSSQAFEIRMLRDYVFTR